MAVTRLKRKDMRNRTKANNRIQTIKQMTKTPIIKNVDVEAIKQNLQLRQAKLNLRLPKLNST